MVRDAIEAYAPHAWKPAAQLQSQEECDFLNMLHDATLELPARRSSSFLMLQEIQVSF
jgi:hypothetical protein